MGENLGRPSVAALHDFPQTMKPPPAWLSPEKPYLIGISGGRDSVFLYHWLIAHQFDNLTCCHLNHSLRGGESDCDEEFLRNLIGPSLLVRKINVAARAEENSLSLETAARQARHEFFADCARQTGINHVLLAHHADDQAETILFNLLRGSAGLKGMKSHHTINGVTSLRPLLDVRRSEIDQFLTTHQIPFREDQSNASPFATRNRLRHEALPLLADIVKRDPVPSLCRAEKLNRDLNEISRETLNSLNLLDPQNRIHIPSFRPLNPALQRQALHRYLLEHGIPELTFDLIEKARLLTQPDAAPSLNLPGGKRLRRKEARLFITP